MKIPREKKKHEIFVSPAVHWIFRNCGPDFACREFLCVCIWKTNIHVNPKYIQFGLRWSRSLVLCSKYVNSLLLHRPRPPHFLETFVTVTKKFAIFVHIVHTEVPTTYIVRAYPGANYSMRCVSIEPLCVLHFVVIGTGRDKLRHRPHHCHDFLNCCCRHCASHVPTSDAPTRLRCVMFPFRPFRWSIRVNLRRICIDRVRCVHWMWLKFCHQLSARVECSTDNLWIAMCGSKKKKKRWKLVQR